MMPYFDAQQHNSQQWNPWLANSQAGQGYGQLFGAFGGQGSSLELAAYGQPYGQGFGQPNFGGWGSGFASRQLSPQYVNEVVRQLVPLLPNIMAQAQQPQAAMGYGSFGQQRQLSPQDVNEVVRQILPIVPQIVSLLQGGQNPLQAAAMYGGYGGMNQYGQLGQMGYGQNTGQQNPYAQPASGQMPFQQFGQPAWPHALAAHGGSPLSGQWQRTLSQQDISEVVRQLTGAIPQLIGNLQAFAQPRSMQ